MSCRQSRAIPDGQHKSIRAVTGPPSVCVRSSWEWGCCLGAALVHRLICNGSIWPFARRSTRANLPPPPRPARHRQLLELLHPWRASIADSSSASPIRQPGVCKLCSSPSCGSPTACPVTNSTAADPTPPCSASGGNRFSTAASDMTTASHLSVSACAHGLAHGSWPHPYPYLMAQPLHQIENHLAVPPASLINAGSPNSGKTVLPGQPRDSTSAPGTLPSGSLASLSVESWGGDVSIIFTRLLLIPESLGPTLKTLWIFRPFHILQSMFAPAYAGRKKPGRSLNSCYGGFKRLFSGENLVAARG